MSDNKNSILSSAMNFALPLGLFWVFRYFFVIGSDHYDVFKYIYNILAIGTPIIYYVLITRYRDTDLGGKISFGECILFSLLLFIFASIIEAVIVCLHLLVINPALVSSQNKVILDMISKMKMPDIAYNDLKAFLSTYGALYYALCTAIANVLIGFFLSLILGYFVSRNNRANPT
ncbi:DUF4199 domain-containing protein [Dysgonomonas macrotermitis]|uniref:DUF4199 domain-containing protein n=1 Tax=Dysgonomonas macrotermitis TaxID=1346286 RepID=A0A1M5H1X1_9BACT|nr:DUF4199 domain-containing protein [Dysgonomonas macrotermitis]SHG09915.1 Protein of unknown function [Dysgonomonas macrotermitis]